MEGGTSLEANGLTLETTLLYLASYYVVEALLKRCVRYYCPQFFEQLVKERKDPQYFAFAMGVLITTVSTPACYQAFREANEENDQLGNPMLSTPSQKFCIASRAVLWASELNRLNFSRMYIAHHLFSIGSLAYHLYSKLPMRIFYAFHTSLVTEIFSTTGCVLYLHGLRPSTSNIAYCLQAAATVSSVIIRLPPILYAGKMIASWHTAADPALWLQMALLCIYARDIINRVILQSRNLKLFQVGNGTMSMRFAQKFEISVYRMLVAVPSILALMVWKWT